MCSIWSGWQNDNDMRVVDAKFDEYALVHTIKTKGGVSEVLNKLYSKSSLCTQYRLNVFTNRCWTNSECVIITGRTTEITDDLKEKFRQFSLDTGILEENIAMLPPNGTF